MRIAFDAKRAFCNFTGLGNHSRTTLDILNKYFSENEFLLYTPKINYNRTTEPYVENPDFRIMKPKGVLKGGLWRTLCLADTMRRDGADIFHGLSNELPLGIGRSGVPSVVTIHDVAFKTFTDMYHWQDRQIYDLKWRYAVRHAQCIIAISECTKRDILRFYDVPEEKIKVVYQPVAPYYYGIGRECSDILENNAEEAVCHNSSSDEKTNHKSSAEEPFMLYVGSVNSRKNLLGIVKAMELLPESVRIPLVIVGDGREYKREVQKYIAEHHMERWCIWKGSTSGGELHRLYAKARLFVYPSYYEGFGLPVVEARLSGCPVISSNVSSLPEASGPYSLLVDPSDFGAMSKAMDSLITDDALHDELAVKGREHAMQTLHPQVLAQQLMDTYNSVL